MTLATSLTQLESAQLVRRLAEPELEYMFKHALVHDVVYESVLKQDRRRLHLATGEALEHIYSQRLDELAPMLAQHFDEAGDPRALRYHIQAGDAAACRYARSEAIQQYTRAIELAKELGAPANDLIRLYLECGKMMEQRGRHAEALAGYKEMESFARERHDRSIELAALIARATIYSTPTVAADVAQGQALSEQALAIARELGDRAAEAKVLWNLTLLYWNWRTEQSQTAIHFGEESIAIARELNLREQLAFTLHDIYRLYLMVGRIERAQATLSEAQSLWRELDNKPMLTDGLTSLAIVKYLLGDFESGLALTREARHISLDIDNLWGQSYSLWITGVIQFELGDYGGAMEAWEQSYRLGEEAGFAAARVNAQGFRAWAYAELGGCEQGARVARTLIDKIPGMPVSWRGAVHAVLAMCQICAGKPEDAQTSIDLARQHQFERYPLTNLFSLAQLELSIAQGNPARTIVDAEHFLDAVHQAHTTVLEPHIRYFAGRAYLDLGDHVRAAQHLSRALEQAEAFRSRRVLWRIYAALGKLEAQRGNRIAADMWCNRAREVIDYIVDHAGSGELRNSFLARSDVRDVLS
jgi:tetratricopeptide (TPR) repeat protein